MDEPGGEQQPAAKPSEYDREKDPKYVPVAKETVEINGNPVELQVFDFREVKDAEPVGNIDIFVDGVAQYENMTPMKRALIDRAHEDKTVLVFPRMPKITPQTESEKETGTPDTTIEAQCMFQAIKDRRFTDKIAESNIKLDLDSANLRVTGWSQGARDTLNLAELIENFEDVDPDNKVVLELWSLVGTVDIEDKPTGVEILKLFNNEVLGITLEEMRLRINKEYLKDPETLKKLDIGIIPPDADQMQIIGGVAKLFKSPAGIKIFASNLSEAGKVDIAFLTPNIKRLAASGTNPLPAFARSEVRSPACDTITKCDIKLTIPRGDTIVPFDKLGAQVRKIIMNGEDKFPQLVEVAKRFEGQDAEFAQWFMSDGGVEDPESELKRSLGKVLFPNAKSVVTTYIGADITEPKSDAVPEDERKKGLSFLANHLGPMKNTKKFLYA
jgi:hypothetical protein